MCPSEPAAEHKGHLILVGITGGIAAYKTASLVSQLVQQGEEVVVLMTDAATRFVGPLTFQSLTGREVITSQWEPHEGLESPHIYLAREAKAMLIAPCSMDMLARLATGRSDDVVSLLAAAIDRDHVPVLLSPSMNATMFQQPATQRNLVQLAEDGFRIIEPATGWQACRTEGEGRMPEPDELNEALSAAMRHGSSARPTRTRFE